MCLSFCFQSGIEVKGRQGGPKKRNPGNENTLQTHSHSLTTRLKRGLVSKKNYLQNNLIINSLGQLLTPDNCFKRGLLIQRAINYFCGVTFLVRRDLRAT